MTTAQEQMEAKGISIGDEVWVTYNGVTCSGVVHSFTAKRVMATNDGRYCGHTPHAYSPNNINKK